MQTIIEFLRNNPELVVSVAAALWGMLWTFVKTSEWYGRFTANLEAKRLSRLWLFALKVAQEMYEEVVRELKAAKQFDAATKASIRRAATARLLALAREEGLPLAQEYAPVLIELAVSYLKNKGKGNDAGALAALPFSPAASPASA